jgi:hypothetical protein
MKRLGSLALGIPGIDDPVADRDVEDDEAKERRLKETGGRYLANPVKLSSAALKKPVEFGRPIRPGSKWCLPE